MVGVVVPREQVVRDGAGVFEGAEAIGKLRPVFERAELGLMSLLTRGREWLADREVGEQSATSCCAWARPVGVELMRTDALLAARGLDEFRQMNAIQPTTYTRITSDTGSGAS